MIADKHLVHSICCGEGGEIIDASMRVVRFVSQSRHSQRSKMLLSTSRYIRVHTYVFLSAQDDGQTKYVSAQDSEATQDL